ncbi:hypothetical protein L7F22_046713 [Adiantum nelumboides]|nr:hypothetical protein [Adiantum nelumboides]
MQDLGYLLIDIAHSFYNYSRDNGWSVDDIRVMKLLLQSWRVRMEEYLGPNSSPLEHVAGNGELLDDVMRHGLHDRYWCYIFEWLVKIYSSIKTNNIQDEASFVQFYLRKFFTKVFLVVRSDSDGLLPEHRFLRTLHGSMHAHGNISTTEGHLEECPPQHMDGLVVVSSVGAAKSLWNAMLKYGQRAPWRYYKQCIVGDTHSERLLIDAATGMSVLEKTPLPITWDCVRPISSLLHKFIPMPLLRGQKLIAYEVKDLKRRDRLLEEGRCGIVPLWLQEHDIVKVWIDNGGVKQLNHAAVREINCETKMAKLAILRPVMQQTNTWKVQPINQDLDDEGVGDLHEKVTDLHQDAPLDKTIENAQDDNDLVKLDDMGAIMVHEKEKEEEKSTHSFSADMLLPNDADMVMHSQVVLGEDAYGTEVADRDRLAHIVHISSAFGSLTSDLLVLRPDLGYAVGAFAVGVVSCAMIGTGIMHSEAMQVITRYLHRECHRGFSPNGAYVEFTLKQLLQMHSHVWSETVCMG